MPYGRSIMSISKPATLTFRIKPILKEALRTAAAQDHRSLSNMVEVLILDYCHRKDISIQKLEEHTVNKERDKV